MSHLPTGVSDNVIAGVVDRRQPLGEHFIYSTPGSHQGPAILDPRFGKANTGAADSQRNGPIPKSVEYRKNQGAVVD